MAGGIFSNKNLFGYKHRLKYTILLALAAELVFIFFAQFAMGPALNQLSLKIGFEGLLFLLLSLFLLLFLLFLSIIRFIGVRRGYFAPAVFVWSDPLLPQNQLECWCVSAYAIWSYTFPVLEGWPLVTGVHRNKKAVENLKESLSSQWGIREREEGIAMVHRLTDRQQNLVPEPGAGWDLCRAAQLLGMMFQIRLIDRKELDRELERTARVIRQQFYSWEELCNSYLMGYERWQIGQPGAAVNIAGRHAIYKKLKNIPHGPYSIPWELEVSGAQKLSKRKERRKMKKLLKGYRQVFS